MINYHIFIITGLSGSGKSTALDALEDAGFYCVDNMPVALLPKLLELPIENGADISGLAFGMDLREKRFLVGYESVLNDLKKKGYRYEIVFLEALDDVLLQRFSQTRRPHPLAPDQSLSKGIYAEKKLLQGVRDISDHVIDTSYFNIHELRAVILNIAGKVKKTAAMHITLLSFGFKHGIPHEADLIMDVRFLVNPYFVPKLKYLSGTDREVQDYVLGHEESEKFLKKYLDLLDYLIPMYKREGKAYLTIATGCTGGRHRSVVMAERICRHFKKKNLNANLSHRDMLKT